MLKKIFAPLISMDQKKLFWESRDIVKYSIPSLLHSRVPLSARAQGWLGELRTNGIVKIELPELKTLADYVDEKYFGTMDRMGITTLKGEQLGSPGLFAIDTNFPIEKQVGVTVLSEVSFKDPHFECLFLNPELTGLLYNYYRRQPYYRNQPVVQKVDFKNLMDAKVGNLFHVDHLHQISGMLLVSDQGLNDTHMEYVLGNHRRNKWGRKIYLQKEEAEAVAARGSIYPLIGKKGTLFIFDTSAVHRRNLKDGRTRKILHFNANTGHNMFNFKETFGDWAALQKSPEYIQRMFAWDF